MKDDAKSLNTSFQRLAEALRRRKANKATQTDSSKPLNPTSTKLRCASIVACGRQNHGAIQAYIAAHPARQTLGGPCDQQLKTWPCTVPPPGTEADIISDDDDDKRSVGNDQQPTSCPAFQDTYPCVGTSELAEAGSRPLAPGIRVTPISHALSSAASFMESPSGPLEP